MMQATENTIEVPHNLLSELQAKNEIKMEKVKNEHPLPNNKEKENKEKENHHSNSAKNKQGEESQKIKEGHHVKDDEKTHTHKEKENLTKKSDHHERKHKHYHKESNDHISKHNDKVFDNIDQNRSHERKEEKPLIKNDKDDSLCYNCGKLGHSSYECKLSNLNVKKDLYFQGRKDGDMLKDCNFQNEVYDRNSKTRMETEKYSSNNFQKNDLRKPLSKETSKFKNVYNQKSNRNKGKKFCERKGKYNENNYQRDHNFNHSRHDQKLIHRSRSRSQDN